MVLFNVGAVASVVGCDATSSVGIACVVDSDGLIDWKVGAVVLCAAMVVTSVWISYVLKWIISKSYFAYLTKLLVRNKNKNIHQWVA